MPIPPQLLLAGMQMGIPALINMLQEDNSPSPEQLISQAKTKAHQQYLNENYEFEGVTNSRMFRLGGEISRYGTPLQEGDVSEIIGRDLKRYKGANNQTHEGYGDEGMSGIPIGSGEVESGETIYRDQFIMSNEDQMPLGDEASMFDSKFGLKPEDTFAMASEKIAKHEQRHRSEEHIEDYPSKITNSLNAQHYDEEHMKLYDIQGNKAESMMRKRRKFNLGNNDMFSQLALSGKPNTPFPFDMETTSEYMFPSKDDEGFMDTSDANSLEQFMKTLESDPSLNLDTDPLFNMTSDPQIYLNERNNGNSTIQPLGTRQASPMELPSRPDTLAKPSADIPLNNSSPYDAGDPLGNAFGQVLDLGLSNADIISNSLLRRRMQNPKIAQPLSNVDANTIDNNLGVASIEQDIVNTNNSIDENSSSSIGANASKIALANQGFDAKNQVVGRNLTFNAGQEARADQMNTQINEMNRRNEQMFLDESVMAQNDDIAGMMTDITVGTQRYNEQQQNATNNSALLGSSDPRVQQAELERMLDLSPSQLRRMGMTKKEIVKRLNKLNQ